MRWWWPPSNDPGDGPPPQDNRPTSEWEADVVIDDGKTPRLVSVKEVSDWMTAAEEREFLIWKQMDDLLLELKSDWPLRTRAIRRELRWLRKEAKKREYAWGRT